jgi:Domain of unknown function (DUF4365)
MKAKPTANTGRIGVAGVQLKVEGIGYSFREQPTSDFGIDAHIEIIENEQATGRLIAAQIKGGPSWFKEQTSEGIIYRGKREHLNYWLNLSLPVIIILYDSKSDTAYWQAVTTETVTSTGKGWKIAIPFSQKIDEGCKDSLRKLAGVTIDMNNYIISSLRDVSHNAAKRYTANILLQFRATPDQVEQVIRLATQDIRNREYYRNEIAKQRWAGQSAQVVALFVYQSPDDAQQANWICQSQWIDSSLAPQFSPVRLTGEEIDDGITIHWSENYTVMRRFCQENTATKEAYLQQLHSILRRLKPLVQEIIRLTNAVENQTIPGETYDKEMEQLESRISQLYLESSEMDLAPYECQDINSSFKSTISFAHNVTLPFSKLGKGKWSALQRKHLIIDSINNYQKEIRRLDIYLEKQI